MKAYRQLHAVADYDGVILQKPILGLRQEFLLAKFAISMAIGCVGVYGRSLQASSAVSCIRNIPHNGTSLTQ
jgi:hypothetical protein